MKIRNNKIGWIMVFLKNLLYLFYLLIHPVLIFIVIAVFTDFDFPIGGMGFLVLCVWYVFTFSGYEFNQFGLDKRYVKETPTKDSYSTSENIDTIGYKFAKAEQEITEAKEVLDDWYKKPAVEPIDEEYEVEEYLKQKLELENNKTPNTSSQSTINPIDEEYEAEEYLKRKLEPDDGLDEEAPF
jgi:hypothetical protein